MILAWASPFNVSNVPYIPNIPNVPNILNVPNDTNVPYVSNALNILYAWYTIYFSHQTFSPKFPVASATGPSS